MKKLVGMLTSLCCHDNLTFTKVALIVSELLEHNPTSNFPQLRYLAIEQQKMISNIKFKCGIIDDKYFKLKSEVKEYLESFENY
jgi:hypothetical protein